MSTATIQTNSKLDLVLERVVDVPRELVWAAWTKPEHIKKWFTPAPWTTVDCEIDLRPGRHFPDSHAFAGGAGVSQCGLLSRDRTQRETCVDLGARPRLPAGDQSRRNGVVRRAVFHGHNHAGSAGKPDEIHGGRNPWRRSDSQEARGDGLLPGLGTALDQLVALAKTL